VRRRSNLVEKVSAKRNAANDASVQYDAWAVIISDPDVISLDLAKQIVLTQVLAHPCRGKEEVHVTVRVQCGESPLPS